MDDQARIELEAIYTRDQALDPHAVVDAARPKDSPLHRYFEWNNGTAAEAWRVHQARQLIRVAVTIIPSISNGRIREFVSLTNLRQTGTGSYLATVDILADDQRYSQARADAITALLGLQARFRYIGELAPVWDAIAQTAASIQRVA